MTLQEVLYLILSLSIIICTTLFVLVVFNLIRTLNAIKRIFAEIEDTAQSLKVVRDGFKVGVLTFLSNLLGREKSKGGE